MILVTGGAGYIGSHTVINLINAGYKICIFDNLENGHIETINVLKSIENDIEFVKGDLRNTEDIEKVLSSIKDYGICGYSFCCLCTCRRKR